MDDGHSKMRFSITPPPEKFSLPTLLANAEFRKTHSIVTSPTYRCNIQHTLKPTMDDAVKQHYEITTPTSVKSPSDQDTAEAASDYNQWLHAMKLVARLPGGMPPEFRRKLWLSLADKYLKSKNVDWSKEEDKCFCEKWREDDEELGIQIVKDLHRTGSNLCTGPAGNINQAKLKRILLGYARYNPEVGYCQGFNMLGALILQVMDKEESESIKVMIYLVEGILPTGYFCGSMGGLQADMGVFRELMQTKLPRLAKHLQKLQGPMENAYEPPLTNVFTMQWFLTMFCTCLPMSCVLRVWDLVLIEGSDILLRTALVLWSLLEERVLSAKTADDFYGKMGSFSSELLNGHLIDSNGLIEKVVQLGAIPDIQKLRDKHLYNIAPLRHKPGLQLYFDDEDPESDEDSRLAVATMWGMTWGRRGSQSQSNAVKQTSENKDRLALDISLLKKQYDRLRERQKQAHIILTTACTTASKQSATTSTSSLPVNQLLKGRSAIVTNKGRRPPPMGAIPPARKPSLPTILQAKNSGKQLKRGETIHWQDMDVGKKRRDSLTWKEIKADRAMLLTESSDISMSPSTKIRSRIGKSDSSSYSEESDNNESGSSTDTSLCDEEDPKSTGDKTFSSSLDNSPKRRCKSSRKQKDLQTKLKNVSESESSARKSQRPKSWAPSSNEIPFMLMTSDTPVHSGDETLDFDNADREINTIAEENETSKENMPYTIVKDREWPIVNYSTTAGDLASCNFAPLHIQTDLLEIPVITSTSELSPMPDIRTYLQNSTISPLPTPKPFQFIDSTNSLGSGDGDVKKSFDVNDDGVTNQYFERVNSVERPKNLKLSYSFNEENSMNDAYENIKSNARPEDLIGKELEIEKCDNNEIIESDFKLMDKASDVSLGAELPIIDSIKRSFDYEDFSDFDPRTHSRDDNIPGENRDDFKESKLDEMTVSDYKRKELSKEIAVLNAKKKRNDPRRLTRSSTIDIEERFQALEKRLSEEESQKLLKTSFEKTISFEKEANHKSLDKELLSSIPTNHASFVDNDDLLEPPKSHLPSAGELESRYHNLTKQMSTSDDKMKKSVNSDDTKITKETEEKQNVEKNSSRDSSEKELKEYLKNTNIKNKISENEDKSKNDDETTSAKRVKRLPSTAELENRYNELERKLSSPKSSPMKTKKEPPDDKTTPDEKNVQEKIEEKQIEKDSFKSKSNESRETTISKTSNNKFEAEPAIKKMPPSTEELEKRFQALEKQMSSSSLKATKASKKEISNQQELKIATENGEDENSEKPANKSSAPAATTIDAMKHFEDKCKAINKQISDSLNTNVCEVLEPESGAQGMKVKNPKESFNEKMSVINKRVQTANVESMTVEQRDKDCDNKSKRRSSEPPSTEDLERRYESLKRRMSSNAIQETNDSDSEMIEEAISRKENAIVEKECPIDEKEEIKNINKKQMKAIEPSSISKMKLKEDKSLKSNKSINKSQEENHINKNEESSSTVADTKTQIPQPPPMPEVSFNDSMYIDGFNQSHRRAIIEELQKKIQTQPNDENLKPSSINPNRKIRRQKQYSDETLEAHANAFYKLENYEPWYYNTTSPHHMVRRFSDLPSRADLENRVQFLEQQLLKKLKKQRCASDSEVTSRQYLKQIYDEMPTTSTKRFNSEQNELEKRVLALEQQLSANSLKLLEAVRVNSLQNASDNYKTPTKSGSGSNTPRKLSTETIDVTGKELVRYTHSGEVEETDTNKPINISINIKMLLNKDVHEKPLTKKSETLPTTEELERRLEILEQELRLRKNSTHLSEMVKVKEQINDEVFEDAKEHKNALQSKEIHQTIPIKEDLPTIASLPDKMSEDVKHKTVSNDLSTKVCEDVKQKTVAIDCKKELQKKSEDHCKTKNLEAEGRKKSTDDQVTLKEKTNDIKPEETIVNDGLSNRHSNEKTKEGNINKNENKQLGRETENVTKSVIKKSSVDEVVSEEKTTDISSKNLKENIKTNNEKSKEIVDEDNNKMNENIQKKKDENVKAKITESIETADTLVKEEHCGENSSQNVIINVSDGGQIDPDKNTLVLLLDNEPKAMKVRRLTRANTEELESLFQALEKQLSDRNLIKSEDGKLRRADTNEENDTNSKEKQAISVLTKEIEEFTNNNKSEENPKPTQAAEVEEEFDWGIDPAKRHLKKRTVHLPSTKELEARFRSLERQIKLLEDVEKIDVEQRLNEIERKIKLQYSLSHEKDLNKFLELCDGKGLDEPILNTTNEKSEHKCDCKKSPNTPPCKIKSSDKTPTISPVRIKSPVRPKSSALKSPYTSPIHIRQRSLETQSEDENIPTTEDLEYRFRALDLPRSKSKENLKKKSNLKKQPIHPLEMLLDPSPDDSLIPTTGELEHRMKVLEEKHKSPSISRHHSQSPSRSKSPSQRKLPTEIELEARMKALEHERSFDSHTQKNFNEFNQKLKNVMSPSLSFEEFKSTKSREDSPIRGENRSSTPKSVLKDSDSIYRRDENSKTPIRSTSPKVIRFCDEEDYRPRSRTDLRETGLMVSNTIGALQLIEENSKILHRILEKTLADSNSSIYGSSATIAEGLDEMGSRLMRETSPLQRTGTHTGVPLRTNDNINERLSSIKESIKSIDSLCEEKPYRKEKCQRYIDSLFSDSVHFANKKNSFEDLASRNSRSRSPSARYKDYISPSIRISDHSRRPSEYYLSRSLGSAESIRSSSSLREATPIHHRSNRELRRDVSPRSRRDEEREEYESRVRRINNLPNDFLNDYSDISSSSLTKFHKVDRQLLEIYNYNDEMQCERSRSTSKSPLRSTYEPSDMLTLHNTDNNTATNYTSDNNSSLYTNYKNNIRTINTSPTITARTDKTTYNYNSRLEFDRPTSPYRQISHNFVNEYNAHLRRSPTPLYNPGKLDIRHTTVTSTFYDRLLTEKQIEKTNIKTMSKSPIASPGQNQNSSIATSTITQTNTMTMSATDQLNSFLGTNASLGINRVSSTSRLETATNPIASPIDNSLSTDIPAGNLKTTEQTAFTNYPKVAVTTATAQLYLQSSDNVLTQLKFISVTTAAANMKWAPPTTTFMPISEPMLKSSVSYISSTTDYSTSLTTNNSVISNCSTTLSANAPILTSNTFDTNPKFNTSTTDTITTTSNVFLSSNIYKPTILTVLHQPTKRSYTHSLNNHKITFSSTAPICSTKSDSIIPNN